MFNQLTLLGNLTRDIELRYTQSGSAVASTGIATSHKYTSNGEKKEETCFIDLTFFGKSGEIANQYLRKGSKVFITGRLKQEDWVDKTSGQKRSKHTVMVETMKMLDGRQDGEKQERQAPQVQYEKHTDYRTPPKHEMPKNTLPEIDIDTSEIPF